MESTDSLRQALEFYQRQFQKKLDELRPMAMTIRQIENDLGIAAEDSIIPTLPFFSPDVQSEQSASTNGKRPSIRPDEYFKKSHGEAARDYLTRVGHAVSQDELLNALTKGGCKVGGVDPKRTLYTALIRNNWQDFINVGNGFIGLRSFYGPSRSPKSKPKQNNKEKPTTRNKHAEGEQKTAIKKQRPTRNTEPSPIKIALREILKDGELHSGDSILQATREQLGSVAPIAVFGALRNGKEFEKVGTDYKLIM
jgi:hypothetical protein